MYGSDEAEANTETGLIHAIGDSSMWASSAKIDDWRSNEMGVKNCEYVRTPTQSPDLNKEDDPQSS